MEGILSEPSAIPQLLRAVFAILTIGLVLIKVSLIVGPVGKDESPLAVGLSVIEISNVQAFVSFVKFAEPVRDILYLFSSYILKLALVELSTVFLDDYVFAADVLEKF
jgi:hypothetical protein